MMMTMALILMMMMCINLADSKRGPKGERAANNSVLKKIAPLLLSLPLSGGTNAMNDQTDNEEVHKDNDD